MRIKATCVWRHLPHLQDLFRSDKRRTPASYSGVESQSPHVILLEKNVFSDALCYFAITFPTATLLAKSCPHTQWLPEENGKTPKAWNLTLRQQLERSRNNEINQLLVALHLPKFDLIHCSFGKYDLSKQGRN